MTQNTNAFEISGPDKLLVISPLGDALSFRDIDLQREGEEIRHMLLEKKITRLIINLNHSNYYGSIMIGMINSFGQQVKENGGNMFLCEASDEMLAILKVMKIDSLWSHYETQSKAAKALKKWKSA